MATPFLATAQQEPSSAAAPALALVGGLIYRSPDERPLVRGVALLQGGKITAVGKEGEIEIPPGVQVLDCTGMVLTAGFWNTHVHFIQRKWTGAAAIPASELAVQLRDMLTKYGFTTVMDTGSPRANTRAIRQRVEAGEVPGPRILTTGEILLPRGGQFPAETMRALGFMNLDFPEVEGPEKAAALAREMMDSGVDALKIYAGTWMGESVVMPLSVVRVIAEEAHKRNKPVLAHPSTAGGLRAAIEGGADILVHTVPNTGDWSAALLEEMRKKNIALIPTLKLWQHETRHDRAILMRTLVDAGIRQLRGYHQAGGTILFGTDCGYMDDYDPTEEYSLMARAGMDFRQILASLTLAPATRFGDSNRSGLLRAGMAADIVVLEADPATEITAFARVRYAVRAGRIVYRRN